MTLSLFTNLAVAIHGERFDLYSVPVEIEIGRDDRGPTVEAARLADAPATVEDFRAVLAEAEILATYSDITKALDAAVEAWAGDLDAATCGGTVVGR